MGSSLHFGAISNPGRSHVMNFGAIGRVLVSRGHRFTFFHVEEFRELAAPEGLGFAAIPNRGISIRKILDDIETAGPFSVKDYSEQAAAMVELFCEGAPAVFRCAGLSCVITDMLEPGGAMAADLADIPYVTLCNAIPLTSDPAVPPDFLRWNYSEGWWGRVRNRLAYAMRDVALRSLHKRLNVYRRRGGLPLYHRPEDSFSRLAQISQLVPEFDFHRTELPSCFYYVGPYRRGTADHGSFPYDRLNGKPIVYASMGTVLGTKSEIWRAVFAGCDGLDVQLVVSLGRDATDAARNDPIAGLEPCPTCIVVDYAPQQEMLRRAAVAITHAGLNSTMEILGAGVPLLAIPITGDQFSVAARIRWHGVGEVLQKKELKAESVRSAVQKLLLDPLYRNKQEKIKLSIANSGGAAQAAEIIMSKAGGIT